MPGASGDTLELGTLIIVDDAMVLQVSDNESTLTVLCDQTITTDDYDEDLYPIQVACINSDSEVVSQIEI